MLESIKKYLKFITMCQTTKEDLIKELNALNDRSKELRKKIENYDVLSIENIDYSSAKKLLDRHCINPDPNNLYKGIMLELVTIIAAVNFIDNCNSKYIPDFNNHSTSKFLPYFRKDSGSWSLLAVLGCLWASDAPFGLYFKSKKSAEYIAKKYLNTHYSIILG